MLSPEVPEVADPVTSEHFDSEAHDGAHDDSDVHNGLTQSEDTSYTGGQEPDVEVAAADGGGGSDLVDDGGDGGDVAVVDQEPKEEEPVVVLRAKAYDDTLGKPDTAIPTKVIRAPITAMFLQASAKLAGGRLVAPDVTVKDNKSSFGRLRGANDDDDFGGVPQGSQARVWNPFAAAGAPPGSNPFAKPAADGSNPFAAKEEESPEEFAARLETVRAEALQASLLFEETLGQDLPPDEDR